MFKIFIHMSNQSRKKSQKKEYIYIWRVHMQKLTNVKSKFVELGVAEYLPYK
jgi:hypothetical protein